MSFSTTQGAFADVRRHTNSWADPIDWDIALGLEELTRALSDELSSMSRKIDALSREVSLLRAQQQR